MKNPKRDRDVSVHPEGQASKKVGHKVDYGQCLSTLPQLEYLLNLSGDLVGIIFLENKICQHIAAPHAHVSPDQYQSRRA